MAIIKWNRWGIPSLLEDENFWHMPERWQEFSRSHGIDIYETDNSIVVEAEIPGVDENNVDVQVEGNVLTINASSEDSDEKKKGKTFYQSSRQTSFNYTTTLPRIVNASKAEADVNNGVVTITIPKSEEEKPKKISVKKK